MPIANQEDLDKWNENNKDPYGSCICKVAEEVMRMLDEEIPEGKEYDPWDLINKADDNINAGGITGFMAGAAAQMVSHCHSRGEEFRRLWNKEIQIGNEGDEANESGGILNPAVLNIIR